MTGELTNIVVEALPHFEGYVYPNEASLHPVWSTLIVIYPYITGLVAGAFIMASLVRVFNVKALAPVYRLSMLTALAFLLCATLAVAVPSGASRALLRNHDDAAHDFAHGDFRFCLCVVFDGSPAAGIVVRFPPGLREMVKKHVWLSGNPLSGVDSGSNRCVGAKCAAGHENGTGSFQLSEFRRPFCCTAMSVSFSARSRPIRGGATC